MKVRFYGTRGSIPVSGKHHLKYGGNTTCLRIESKCLPEKTALVVDSGSGIFPLGDDVLNEGVELMHLLTTHYHHDHTQGLLLCPATYSPNVRFSVYGPIEEGFNPRKVLEYVMRTPFHPVNFTEVGTRFRFVQIEVPSSVVLVFHPEAGMKKVAIEELDGVQGRVPSQIKIGNGHYNISECLVVRMYYTNHPERTISYRFEERPTGKVFVFLTDHENLDQMPCRMRTHLKGADFLVMDSQYDRETYNSKAAGFGHGTPDYCVRTANEIGAKVLGLTHHNPRSTDAMIDAIEYTAQGCAIGTCLDAKRADSDSMFEDQPQSPGRVIRVFACQDFQEIDV
ncbi:MAG: MBL fold metallo-hydrolase [Patescibacteria group bacterium]